MKNLKQIATVVIVAILMLGSFNGNAQKGLSQKKKEEIKINLVESMASFVEGLGVIIHSRPELFYGENCKNCKPSDLTYPNLVKGLGMNAKKISKEGDDLLYAAYLYIKNSTSQKSILNNYDGKEMAKVALFLAKQDKVKSSIDSEAILFGVNSINDLTHVDSQKGCCFFCLRCHLGTIFGETGGGVVMNAIITWLINFL